MLNQPQPVFSYTIPYYTSENGESNELFVSEPTYESFLKAQKKMPLYVISGSLHPVSEEYGQVTSTLFDKQQSIIVIGTKDIAEYTNEIMDINIAGEIERILLFEEETFIRYLYDEQTPEYIQIFIDDIQQALDDIAIGKQLIKKKYRIILREEEIMEEVVNHAQQLEKLKKIDPYKRTESLFLLNKLFCLYHLDRSLYKKYKQKLHPHCPRLFTEHEILQKAIKKVNLSTNTGRQKAAEKIFKELKYDQYIRTVTLSEIPVWKLPSFV